MDLYIQEKKFKIDFQHGNCGGHLVFLIGAILAIFDLQIILMILTKFQVKWPFGLGEEAKIRFSRWPPWHPSWIFDRNFYSYVDLPSPLCFLPSFKSTGLSVQKKKGKTDFQGGHLGFAIRTIFFSIFDLQVIPKLSTMVRVSWLFGSGEEVKNRFSRWLPWLPSWISDRNDLSYIVCVSLIYKSPRCFLPRFELIWPLASEEEAKNRFSRWPWISNRDHFIYF